MVPPKRSLRAALYISGGFDVIFLKKLLNDLTFPLSHLDSVDGLFFFNHNEKLLII